ncbi:hypothetical protein EDC01DRAFT_719252 [Geopyxis carbonaria]|nr:hypothetical protein EDC01DRAFT_719252 [Geopyxis carbonaria]
MFLPRQVQKNYTVGHPAPLPKSSTNRPAVTSALTKPSNAPTQLPKPDIDPTAAKDILATLEQLFISQNPHTNDDYLHFAALLDCPYLADTKPKITLITLRRAFAAAESRYLQLSTDGYHIRFTGTVAGRRRLKDDNTVYVEPMYTGITQSPGQVSRQLEATLPESFLPVLFTSTGSKAWAFVTLSQAVTETEVSNDELWPAGWKVLTQSEWQRRDNEYQQLRMEALHIREVAAAESRTARMDLDGPPTPPAEEENEYPPGLIVHIRNLSESVNKPTISSFIDRSVDRYTRRKAKKEDEGTKPSTSTRANINYIDYSKGTTEAWLRQSAAVDSQLIVRALEKRKRVMKDGKDGKGRKAAEPTEPWIEREYWRRIEDLKERSGKKKAKGGKTSVVDVRAAGKRPRNVSTTSGMEQKKLRYDEI